MRGEEPGPLRLKEFPVDQRRQLHQLMAHVCQPRAQEIILFGATGLGLHHSIRNCRVLGKNLPNPATHSRQYYNFIKQNQYVESCSGWTNYLNGKITHKFWKSFVAGFTKNLHAGIVILSRGYDLASIMRAGGWSNAETVSRYLRFSQHNIWNPPKNFKT